MNFEQTYHSMNECIAPSDALIVDTLARARQGQTPKRQLRRAVVIGVAAAITLSGTAAALQTTGHLSALYTAVSRWLSPVAQSCTKDGITLQVESAYLQGHMACVVFTLRDTQGDRLFGVDLLLDGYRIDGWTMGSGSYQLLDWNEDAQTATFFAEFSALNRTLDSKEPLTFSVNAVTPVLSKYNGEPLPVILSDVPMQSAVQSHTVDHCFLPDSSKAPQSYDFLTPQTPLWQSENGLFSLSAAYLDGQLHLQLLANQAEGANGLLELLDGNGQTVAVSASYSYTANGLYCWEAIYDMSLDALADCTPVLYGSEDGTVIEGDWQVTFRLEDN